MKSIILISIMIISGCVTSNDTTENKTIEDQVQNQHNELLGEWLSIHSHYTIYVYKQEEEVLYIQGVEYPIYYHTRDKSLFIYSDKNQSDILEFVRL